MRTLLICVVMVVALGFYCRWFQISTAGSPEHSRFQVTVNKDKIRQDVNKVKEEVQTLGGDLHRKAEILPK